MVLKTSILVLTITAVCMADLPNMGPCNKNVKTQADFAFDKFHTENGGNWQVAFGPGTDFNKNLSSFTIKITPTGDDQYRDILYTHTKDGQGGILADEIITNKGDGVCTATTTDGSVYIINVLKYVEGSYCLYYICSPAGTDRSTDYRYVLFHGSLTPAQVQDITAIDNSYGFKTKLIRIGG